MGYLMDVSSRANEIRCITEREADLLLMLELSESPVALFDLHTGKVLAQNEAACQLFLYSAAEFRTLSLPDLYHPGMAHLFQGLCAKMSQVKLWEGRAQFMRKTHAAFAADARVRFLDYHGQQLLRVSWTQVQAAVQASTPPRANESGAELLGKRLAAQLEGLTDIERILAAFLEAQLPSISFDAIMFSDIHMRKNRVFVYSAGKPFATMPQGTMFSFEGTIAQDIERFKLDTLFVDDTLDSIKAIDWALFIPKGVRSYFAKPFYERGVLRSVLILCSLKPGQFPSEGLPEYAALFAPFKQAIQSWRKAQRHPPDRS
jgi:PAS domain-containing protein